MSRGFWIDAAERVVWTFVQAFTASLIATGFTDLGALQAAAIAGLSAVLAVLKAVAAERLEGTAQLIPFRSGR